jgi:hypothetical protein
MSFRENGIDLPGILSSDRSACILPGVKAKKTEKGAVDRRAKLEKELRAAIGEIDEKGLLFLLRQAQVLIHNARVESMAGQQQPEEGAAATAAPLSSRSETVSIEQPEGSKTIFLTIGRTRKVLTPEEMKRLVRICYGAGTKSEALHRLFTVLVKERKDILADAMIGSPDNPLVAGLFSAVRATYRLEDR